MQASPDLTSDRPVSSSALQIDFDWGVGGIRRLAPLCDALVLVDTLSFTTAVSVAMSRGAFVHPCRWRDDQCVELAELVGAHLAGPRRTARFSLSPDTLKALEPGEHIVLPSPNGATLSFSTGDTPTYAGCLRNAGATAVALASMTGRLGVIACGERWPEDNSLRPALEDLLGAGAVLSSLEGELSVEAKATVAAYNDSRAELQARLLACVSGRELTAMGFRQDVIAAAQLNADACAAKLVEGVYVPQVPVSMKK